MLGAALVIENAKLLLVHNIKKELRIEPPGGKVKTAEGETPQKAAIREPYEELGIDVELLDLLGVYPTETPEGTFDAYMYLATRKGEIVLKEPEKIGHAEWYSWDELQMLADKSGRLVPNMKAALNDLEPHMKRR